MGIARPFNNYSLEILGIDLKKTKMNTEQEIWNEFKDLSKSSFMDKISISESKSHFGLQYEDRGSLIHTGITKRLENDEDYKINKFLLSIKDNDNIDWSELEKLYPKRDSLILPPKEIIAHIVKFRTHKERKEINFLLLHDWELNKDKLYSKIPDEHTAIQYLEDIKFNGELPTSPFDANSKVYRCKDFKYKCKNTGKYFNARTNTAFDNTKLPLLKWYEVMYLLTSIKTRKISTHQLARHTSITQKTAWVMANKIQSKIQHDFIKQIRISLFK